jgi:hypothetical protein
VGHRVALGALAAASVVGVLGCGGAGKHAHTKPISSFSSQCDNCVHRYTVKQVETAFAAQGIRLHKATRQPISGFVALQGGQKPHLVTTLVRLSATKTKRPRLSHSLRLDRKHLGNDFAFIAEPSGRDYRIQRAGNVIVSFDPSHAQSVTAALARFH